MIWIPIAAVFLIECALAAGLVYLLQRSRAHDREQGRSATARSWLLRSQGEQGRTHADLIKAQESSLSVAQSNSMAITVLAATVESLVHELNTPYTFEPPGGGGSGGMTN